ncbi:MAG: hypothetical protein FJ090_11570 [Deltaproteobacteria bacterium]|nr:hypothetical protein [Deltaproteobacteria bacterium]
MKLLESLRIRARSALRARVPSLAGIVPRPPRVDLRLDDFDGPGNVPPATLDIDGWQEQVVAFVQWAGPMPARLIARADHRDLADLVRFCHRLEMATTVRTGPAGLSHARAEELLDRGMAACELVVDALDAEAEAAARALVHARHSRAGQLTVHLHVRGHAEPGDDLSTRVRSLGLDRVVASPPWVGPDGLPGDARRGSHCPVASRRVLLMPDGRVTACPFKGGAASTFPPDLADHRAAIHSCDRACAHPETA